MILKTAGLLELLKKHLSVFVFLLSSVTVFLIYPSLSRYNLFITVFVVLLYCAFILFGKNKYVKIFLSAMPVLFIIFFYCFISFSSYYPSNVIPGKSVKITNFTGRNFYNFLASSFKKGKLSMPVEPSEKLKALKNPYDPKELNSDLSWQKFDYLMDLSYYKGKYYLYFGVTPVLTVYLPFLLITKHFITDALVTLLFGVLSFLTALCLLKKITAQCRADKDGFFLNAMSVIAVGFSSAFCYLISLPRVYEVAIICGVFFTLLSFLFILYFFESQTNKKKNIMLFLAGLCIALAVGCRPFYAFAVFVQAFVIIDRKNFKSVWKQYVFYLLPLVVYAFVLMAYNYARFDSVFQFGGKYQLSLIDMYNWKISPGETVSAIVNFIAQAPVYVSKFPYVIMDYVVVREKLAERVVGAVFTAPFLAVLLLSFLFFKSKNVLFKYKKYVAGMLATGFFVLVVVSTVGSIYRYAADFYVYFIIPALVIMFYLNAQAKIGWRKILFQYLITVLLLMGAVFGSAITISSSSEIIKHNNPELLYKMSSLI